MAATVPNLTIVASHFGVSEQTVRQQWRGRGMPGRRGQWDLVAITAWRAADVAALQERREIQYTPGLSAQMKEVAGALYKLARMLDCATSPAEAKP